MEKKKIRLSELHSLKVFLRTCNLNTVCESARCPNINSCFEKRTATFLLLGSVCSRHCLFCNVNSGKPEKLDTEEPYRVLEAVKKLNLKHVVLTSVTRDDLEDGGSDIFVKTIKLIKENSKTTSVEILVPDFKGDEVLIKNVLSAKPDVFNHNIETTKILSKKIRPQADYNRSLEVLKFAKKSSVSKIKSGFMLGLGEAETDILDTINDLSFIDILTIGQYFKPNSSCIDVQKYYSENEFKNYETYAKNLSYKYVFSGPYVRSSYMAEEVLKELK